MKNFKVALITEAFGHGFMSLNFAKAYNLQPVAFSVKETEEEFNADVEAIFQKLSCVGKKLGMRKASWEERDELISTGWNVRQSLIDGKITPDMWYDFAGSTLEMDVEGEAPQFKSLWGEDINVFFAPQKLHSDGACGATAQQQSLPLEVYKFMKLLEVNKILGQHFHKVNDLEKVQQLANDFNLYVPGLDEDHEVLGVRGVPHWKYANLYKQLDLSIGVLGTHTWVMLTCFPNIPQIITCYEGLSEDAVALNNAYSRHGKNVFFVSYNEETLIETLQEDIEMLVEHILF